MFFEWVSCGNYCGKQFHIHYLPKTSQQCPEIGIALDSDLQKYKEQLDSMTLNMKCMTTLKFKDIYC